MSARALWVPLLLAACAAPAKYHDDPVLAARPDTQALVVETTVRARHVTLVLAERWNTELKLSAQRRETPAAGVVRATGTVVLDLRELHVEADEVELRFLADPEHEDILLHARDVTLFLRKSVYGHRTENADLVTLANDQVNIFKQ